jgi:hypothetical protein
MLSDPLVKEVATILATAEELPPWTSFPVLRGRNRFGQQSEPIKGENWWSRLDGYWNGCRPCLLIDGRFIAPCWTSR